MTARVRLNQCVDCGGETANRNLICDRCTPQYAEIGRCGECPPCRSDLAAIVPCEAAQ